MLSLFRSPYIGFVAAAILTGSAAAEFLDQVADPPVGVHHGALAYGIFLIVRSLAEVVEKTAKLKREAGRLKVDRSEGASPTSEP